MRPLLTWPEQAAFLLPSQDFRQRAPGRTLRGPVPSAGQLGTADPTIAFANRLAWDGLWDAEVRAHATELGLPLIGIDGTHDAPSVANTLARQFRL